MLITIFLSTQFCLADDNTIPAKDTVLTLKKWKDRPSKNRPNTPEIDSQYITCSYSDGVITLYFAEPEGMCRGSVSDLTNGRMQLITFDSSDCVAPIEIGTLGDFYIEFTTDLGNTYSGSTTDF